MSSTHADRAIEDGWLGCVYAWFCTSATVGILCRRLLTGMGPYIRLNSRTHRGLSTAIQSALLG
jgi:hypothetical protein